MVGHQTEQDSLNDFYVTVHCPLVSPTGSVLINKHVSHSRTVSTSVACHGTSHIAYAPQIDGKTSLPFDQAWSRASKKVGPLPSIDQGPEKYASQVAENGHFPIILLVHIQNLLVLVDS